MNNNKHKSKLYTEEEKIRMSLKNKGRIRTKETKEKISKTMKEIGGNSGTWKKGKKAWNVKDKKKLKRKLVKFNGKLILNSHYVFCSYYKLECVPKGFVIHHKDGNSLNDSIDNLIMMTDKAHKQFHHELTKQRLNKGETKA